MNKGWEEVGEKKGCFSYSSDHVGEAGRFHVSLSQIKVKLVDYLG